MIEVDAGSGLDALVPRLIARATALASARARSSLLARRRDESRWRRAHLLWPLFPKG